LSGSSFVIVRPSEKRALQRSLLAWYSLRKRDLPWRKTRDPYRIMVSEFMLQQTRIETVIRYYDRFLRAFPSLRHLARASLEDVLRMWAGLGYYARARNLHAAAQKILKDFGGKIPVARDDLLSLPGFGPYTAGAVSSIAFDQPEAAVDGNVRRVLSRFLGRSEGKNTPISPKEWEKIAKALIPAKRASAFNQALMDLGAMVCVPGKPRCPSCPLRKSCSFREEESPARKRAAKKMREETWLVALVERKGRFLMLRKEGRGLLAGLWQFPVVVVQGAPAPDGKEGERDEKKALRIMLPREFGLRIKVLKSLPPQEHLFTHIHAFLKPYLCSVVSANQSASLPARVRWLVPSQFSRYPVSRAMSKILPSKSSSAPDLRICPLSAKRRARL